MERLGVDLVTHIGAVETFEKRNTWIWDSCYGEALKELSLDPIINNCHTPLEATVSTFFYILSVVY